MNNNGNYIENLKQKVKDFFFKDEDFQTLKIFHITAINSPLITETFYEKYKSALEEKKYMHKYIRELIIIGLFYKRDCEKLIYLLKNEQDGIIKGKILDLISEIIPCDNIEENFENLLNDLLYKTKSNYVRRKILKLKAKFLSSEREKFYEIIRETIKILNNLSEDTNAKKDNLENPLDILRYVKITDNNNKNELKKELKGILMNNEVNGFIKYKAFEAIVNLFSSDINFIKETIRELLNDENNLRHPSLIKTIHNYLLNTNFYSEFSTCELFKIFSLNQSGKPGHQTNLSVSDLEKYSLETLEYEYIYALLGFKFREIFIEENERINIDLKKILEEIKTRRKINKNKRFSPYKNLYIIYNLLGT